jgi:hypothetical protein
MAYSAPSALPTLADHLPWRRPCSGVPTRSWNGRNDGGVLVAHPGASCIDGWGGGVLRWSPPTATQAKLRRAPHRRSQDELEIKSNQTKMRLYLNPLGAAAFKAGDERHPNCRLALLYRACGEKGRLVDYLCHTRT